MGCELCAVSAGQSTPWPRWEVGLRYALMRGRCECCIRTRSANRLRSPVDALPSSTAHVRRLISFSTVSADGAPGPAKGASNAVASKDSTSRIISGYSEVCAGHKCDGGPTETTLERPRRFAIPGEMHGTAQTCVVAAKSKWRTSVLRRLPSEASRKPSVGIAPCSNPMSGKEFPPGAWPPLLAGRGRSGRSYGRFRLNRLHEIPAVRWSTVVQPGAPRDFPHPPAGVRWHNLSL